MKARRPREVPEGVEEVVHLDSKSKVLIDYYLNDKLWASYNQGVYNKQNVFVNNEAVVLEYINIHGYEGIIFKYNTKDEIILVWNDGVYIYHIVTIGTVNELISMAESIE